jgi:hypothetical protein
MKQCGACGKIMPKDVEDQIDIVTAKQNEEVPWIALPRGWLQLFPDPDFTGEGIAFSYYCPEDCCKLIKYLEKNRA